MTQGASPASMPSAGTRIRVCLLDDEPLIRAGVRAVLEQQEDIDVVADAATSAQALDLVLALKPDVALLDVRLPEGNGVEVCREIRARQPATACLMLTSFADDHAVLDAIEAGASGYVLKHIQGPELVEAIRTVAAGHSTLDPKTTARLLARIRERATDAAPIDD